MDYLGFNAYEKSINRMPVHIFMIKDEDGDAIIVEGENPGFEGTRLQENRTKVPLTHKNA
jgi:hypothetical protein